MKRAPNMDDVFEQLYKYVGKDEENDERESLSGYSQNSSNIDNVTASQNSSSSPQMTLEMLTQYKHWSKDIKTYKRGKSVSSTESQNVSLVYIEKCKVAAKSSKTSHQERSSTARMQNGSDNLCDEPEFEDSHSTHNSDVENFYENVDGYESGVTKEQSDKQYLCKECSQLYKNARKRKKVKIYPKKPAYSHWRSKFWMMMNQAPSQRRNKRNKKEQMRNLKYVVRKLVANRHARNLCLKCSRSHSFLKRNLRLTTRAKKTFDSLNGSQKKRKRTMPAQKSFQRSTAEREEESLSCSIKTKDKKTYKLVLDSSEEEETTLNVKRYKFLDKGFEHVSVQKPKEKSPPMPNILVEPINNSPKHGDIIDLPDNQDHEDLASFQQSLNTNAQNNDDESESDNFGHVQGGSFRELLQRLKSGCIRSSIVRENQI